MRASLRGAVPLAVRRRLRALRRAIDDRRAGTAFARQRGDPASFPHTVSRYERPLICYPGQEAAFPAKRGNTALVLAAVDGVIIAPGETFSFWRLAGRPTRGRGYAPAAALRDGVLINEVGGAICLPSTLLFNIALLAGMQITERRCHSVDSYGGARYFELGRDAAVEHPYIDLRFRNPRGVPMLLRAGIAGDAVVAEMRAPHDLGIGVAIDVEVRESAPLLRVRARRTVTRNGTTAVDEWESVHRAGDPPRP